MTKFGWGLDGRVVVIGDTHFPFHNEVWFEWMLGRIAAIKPKYVVQIGDLYDYFCLSKYAKTVSLLTPEQEVTLGRAKAEEMWRRIKVPLKYQIKGNHDDRAEKRLLEKCPELEPLVDLKRLFTFPNVETVHDSSNELFIGDVLFTHGEYPTLGDHAKRSQVATVHGHLHRAGLVFLRNRNGVFFELDAGFGGDRESLAFAYRKQRVLDGWTLGLGVIDEAGPRFELWRGEK